MSVADVVARSLRAAGVEVFFQVTGGDQGLWFALKDAGIRMIPCRTEPGAAYMADGYARAGDRLGIVYGQQGPGAVNVASGLADAHWAMSPVVSITSAVPVTARDHHAYQEVDQLAVFRPLTRLARRVDRADLAADTIRLALEAARGVPPGPAHVELPRDVLREEISTDVAIRPPRPLDTRVPLPAGAADAIVDRLAGAERPVIVAGAGVVMSDGWDALLAAAERLGVPVATTPGGKGAIREDHPLAIGVIGRYSRAVANDLVCQADAVLVVGSRLGALSTREYTVPSPAAAVILVDLDPGGARGPYELTARYMADARTSLAEIARSAERRDGQASAAWRDRVAGEVAAWRRRAEAAIGRPTEPLHPAAVIDGLREHLAPTDLLVADTGYMAAWTAALYPVVAPGRHYLRATGSLGWALPASIGAALARPDRHVVGVIGDGGAAYHVAELETAVRCAVPVVVVVLNNSTLAFEYHEQKLGWGRVLPEVNDFGDVDFAGLARSLGAFGARARTSAELSQALDAALAHPGPALVDVVVDREPVAPVSSFEGAVAREY
jgi:acetolactate synthase-1/2/3 large subunit